MKLPAWLYHRSGDLEEVLVRRWGSRRPLRMVFTIISDAYSGSDYLLSLGKLGIQYGGQDAISEGHKLAPPGTRSRIRYLHSGRALGLTWEASRARG